MSALFETFVAPPDLPIQELYAPLLGPSLPFLQKLLAGVTSGALGALIASPCDLVKVQMQASRSASVAGAPPYRNTFAAFTTIYGKGGLRALWRGVGPTTLRAAVLTSTQVSLAHTLRSPPSCRRAASPHDFSRLLRCFSYLGGHVRRSQAAHQKVLLQQRAELSQHSAVARRSALALRQ